MENFDEKDIDENVVDVAAYKVWQRFEAHPILNEGRVYTATDGKEYNLGLLMHALKKKIQHLPKAEQDDIIEQKKLFASIRAKANMAKNKAYNKRTGSASNIAKEKGKTPTTFNEIKSREADLMELFGSMHSAKEVHKICIQDWGLKVSLETLEKFRKYYNKQIHEKIEVFKNSTQHMRLAQQAGRLEELCWLYMKAKEKYVEGNHNRNDGFFAKELLKDIKSEIEGDKLIIDANMNIDIESTVNLHIQKEALDALLIRQLIIGKAAAKLGVEPSLLINRLTKSYYKGYSNIVDSEEADYADIEYPSNEHYDFDKIQKISVLSKEKEEDEHIHSTPTENTRETKLSGENSTKDKLLAMIAARKKKIESSKLDIQKHEITRKHKN